MKNSSRKILSIVLSIAMIFTAMAFCVSAADFDASWTAITNAEELKAIENDMAGKYYLANDIELEGWSPIGWLESEDVAFTGEFDGNGKTVWGVETESGSNAGLFAINAGTIKNVTVSNAQVNVSAQGGVIAGTNEATGVISNCTVIDSIVTGSFTTSSKYKYWLSDGYQVGGVVGLNKGTVEKCVNKDSDVRGWLEVGGIVGHNEGTVSQCASSGDINSTNSGIASQAQVNRMRWAAQSAYLADGECAYGRAGGVVGYNAGEVSDVFVSGSESNEFVDVAGWNSVGGLCGKNEGTVKNAYSVGTQFTIPSNGSVFTFPSLANYTGTYTWTSDIYVHPLVASQEKGTTENSFYAQIVNGSIPAQATKDGNRGTECSIDEMKDNKDMYVNAGWDFDNIWTIDSESKLPVFSFLVECKHENTEVIGAKDPTCTEPGYTGDVVCKDCGEVISKGDVIPAKGHTWGEWVTTKEATCTEAGEATRTCSVCGATETKEIPAKGHGEGTVIDAKDPTCTEPGYTGDVVCPDCGEVISKGDVIPAKGHTWGEWVTTKEATCTEAGEATRTCSVCGATETKEIPAKGHGEGTVIDAKDPTCTEPGYTGDVVCPDCGEVISKGDVIPAKGHTDADGDGYCDDCGADLGGHDTPSDPSNPSNPSDDGGICGGNFFGKLIQSIIDWFKALMKQMFGGLC